MAEEQTAYEEVYRNISDTNLRLIRVKLYNMMNPSAAYQEDPLKMANAVIAKQKKWAEEISALLPEIE